MRAIAITYVLSWEHAMRIVRKLSVKKHRSAGYSFDIDELNERAQYFERRVDVRRLLYSHDYNEQTKLYKLTVYKEKPIEDK